MNRRQKINKYVTVRNYTIKFSVLSGNSLIAGEVYGKKNKELSCFVTKFHFWNNKVSYFDTERKVPAYVEKAIREFKI